MKNVYRGSALALLAGLIALGCSSPSDDNPSNGGSSGAAGVTGSSSEDLCDKQYDAMVSKCGAAENSRSGNVLSCRDDERDYQGIGCSKQYDSWLQCTTQSGYDCAADTGCESSQNSYFGCQSQAVIRTGCVRLGSQDVGECKDPSKPYAFSCLATAPTQCTQVVTQGAGIWCCPQL